jgi:hypothetical protein
MAKKFGVVIFNITTPNHSYVNVLTEIQFLQNIFSICAISHNFTNIAELHIFSLPLAILLIQFFYNTDIDIIFKYSCQII